MHNIDLTKNRNILKHKKILSHIKMDEEILTLGDIGNERKIIFTATKVQFYFKVMNFEKVLILISKKISSGEKKINTLLVTCKMIIKLSLYI